MEALFPRWTNSVAGASVAGVVAVLAAVPVLAMTLVRSPWITSVGETVEQPVQFDHRHHVRDDGISCLYCHFEAERSRYAGVPPTSVCMGCHGQIYTDAPLLAPVRESALRGEPIPWRQIHVLPDFVFFDHGSHVLRGVDCSHCHGAVETMPQVVRVAPLTMRWCLDCHRENGGPTTCSACHR